MEFNGPIKKAKKKTPKKKNNFNADNHDHEDEAKRKG